MSGINGEILFKGSLNGQLSKSLQLFYDKFKLLSSLKYEDENLNIKNGKIFLDENNIIDFTGEISTPQIYDFHLKTENPLSGTIKSLNFKNIIFESTVHRELNNKSINLVIKGDNLRVDNLNFIKNTNVNGNLKVFLKQFIVNDERIEKLDASITRLGSNLKIKKLNFTLNEGDFLFSFIKGKNFQIAADIKHINIKDLLRINNILPEFDGKLNITFIGEGKNSAFTYGKGYFFIEDFKFYGIDIDNLAENIKNNNIVNLKLKKEKDIKDNSSISFEIVKGFIKPKGKFLNFSKLSLNHKNYYLILNGTANINNGTNIILNGLFAYKNKNYKTNVIININLEKNLLQIIKKE